MSGIDWPLGWERTDAGDREKNNSFEKTLADTSKDLKKEMERLDPDDWSVSTGSGGSHTRPNGLPKHSANPSDPGAVVRWTDDGEQYAVACDDSPRLRDNLRSVFMWLRETRMRSNRPVETGQSAYAAAALPSGDETVAPARPPHVVLGIDADASDEEITEAYRNRVKETHPDNDGDIEEYRAVQNAREEMMGGDRR